MSTPIRQVVTSRNATARGFITKVLERDEASLVFDHNGDLQQSTWKPIYSVAAGTKKAADRNHGLLRAEYLN
jgi:hypothetical protein